MVASTPRTGESKKSKTQAKPTPEPKVELSYEEKQEKVAELKYKREPTCIDRLLFGKVVRLVYMLILCFLLGLIVPYILATYAFIQTSDNVRGTCALNVSYRFDCLPGKVTGEDQCHALGCCYNVDMQDMYAPICYHSVPSEYGYIVEDTNDEALDSYPVFHRMGSDEDLTLNLTFLRKVSNFGTPSWPLQLKIQRRGNDVVRILLWSPGHDDLINDDFISHPGSDQQLDVVVEEQAGGDFNVTVVRLSTNETVLETVFGPLIYSENYMEITTRLPTYNLYGLGQRDNFDLTPDFGQRERWALYNREDEFEAGSSSSSLAYGSHPFFMNFENSGDMYGVYLKNSGPVEVGVLPIPAVIFRAVVGALDLRVMAGPRPRDVTQQYTSMVGVPAFPPYWSLGYHLCRTSDNSSEYDFIVDTMEEVELPYESDCIDTRLNYPNSYAALSSEAQQKIQQMRNSSRKFLLVQYPFLPVDSSAYNASRDMDVLLKLNDSIPYFGTVEGQAMGYPDYFDDKSSDWLSQYGDASAELYSLADGVILLRNSPLNEAVLNYVEWMEPFQPNCTASTPEECCPSANLPFLPFGLSDINNRTLCSFLEHPGLGNVPHMEDHNAYGSAYLRRVYQAMQETHSNTRPFLTSQTTDPGTGVHGGHLGGFYTPDFISQKMGLVQVLEMGLYGVPMVGAPLCGTVNDTKEELRSEWCLRAHQTGAFYPLMISYNEHSQATRNPPNLGKGFSLKLTLYIRQRYMILPYMYTLLYEAHTQGGVPVVRPLFYEFPHDLGSRGVSSQFLVGEGLMVSPVFTSVREETSVPVHIHFPPGCWYNLYTGALFSNSFNGTDQEVPTLLTDVNVHVRGGVVLPLQGNLQDAVMTTEEFRAAPLHLLVALSCQVNDTEGEEPDGATAYGRLYVDDGATPLEQEPPADHLQMLVRENSELTVTRLPRALGGNGICGSSHNISTLITSARVFGAPQVNNVVVNGKKHSFTREDDTGAFTVTKLDFDWCVEDSLVISWQ